MDFTSKEAHEIKDLLVKGEVSSQEVIQFFLQRIEDKDPKINAFITVNKEGALKRAQKLDQLKEKKGKLFGIPIAIKDMLCTKGLRTTAGSKILENFIPPYTATVVKRLEEEGAIVIGKANQDEFAMGSSNETSYFGPSKNPWNFEYVPGGSSGGSAAAVSARMAPLSIGTDTGGSIRQPAHFCGVVGVKPTYGRVSRYGVIAFASSLDQVGPFSLSVKDSALVLEVICGWDANDSTTAKAPVSEWSQNLSADLKGLKVGLPKEYFTEALSEDVRQTLDRAIEAVKQAGAHVEEVSLPLTRYAVPIYYIIATSEASSNLARYDGVRFGFRADFSREPARDLVDFYSRTRGEGFGTEVKRRIILGTHALSSGYYDAYYKKACQVRFLLREDFSKAFEKCDVLMSPVATTSAFKLGERIHDPLTMYTNDIYTTSSNLAGLPSMSVPVELNSEGLPVGVQISASHFEEQKMLNVAFSLEKAFNFKAKRPKDV
ncbi:MAG: Asp-tRNA(Asn)/Glu-tRNA(Gln) amidotransferase subunit GatA [Bdellovibrio sp.]|nr:MAG: Asp-tRNA(Asn)/Glu-tRNA(Gln) amidotransferase subunit GatA [Bdellovibrio sp.]